MARLSMAKRASFPRVPAWPIVLAVDRFRGLYLTESQKRAIRQWRANGSDHLFPAGVKGERVCEAWLGHLRLNWWDVWDEQTVPSPSKLAEIRHAFQGCDPDSPEMCEECWREFGQLEIAA